MKNNTLIKKKYIILLLMLIIFIPWFNANYFDNIKPEELGTENTSFYEINPCKISLFEYLSVDYKSIYQNHYFFRFNDYSSISCFGRVSGIALTNNIFYISIGTNALVNLILQGAFWLFLILLIKKDTIKINIKYKKSSVFLTVILITYSIFSQKRFYEEQLYMFDLNSLRAYFLISLAVYLIVQLLSDISLSRLKALINYTPYLYLTIGVVSGFNIIFFAFPLLILGFNSVLNLKNFKFNMLGFIFLIIWVINFQETFTFSTDKLRGFTSSTYDIYSIIFWSLFIIILINGLAFFYKECSDYFNFEKFLKNFSIASISIFTLGLLVSNLPIINFLVYYFFGQQKYGIRDANPFIVDILNNNEKVPWRGFYPSAESIGEFYGLLICFVLYKLFKQRGLSILNLIAFLLSGFGLYFANNKTVFILVLLVFTVLLIKEIRLPKSLIIFIISAFSIGVFYIVGFSNLTYPYEYSSATLFEQALKYKDSSITSSSLKIFIDAFEKKSFLYILFSFFGYISYLFNRSELWGIFIARFNPNLIEFLFGTSPFNLSKHYSQVKIKEQGSLLLPHSSILSYLLYIGIIGLLLVITFLIVKTYKSRKNLNIFGSILLLYIIVNIFKSDSLNYFSSFVIYSQLYFFTIFNENDKLLK